MSDMKFACASRTGDEMEVLFSDDVIFSFGSDNGPDFWADRPNVILTPEAALGLAIALMDWARENWDDEDDGPVGSFEDWAEEFEPEDAAPAIDGWIEDAVEEYHAAKAEEITEDFTGSPYAINQSGYPVAVQREEGFECPCEVCREWRMRN